MHFRALRLAALLSVSLSAAAPAFAGERLLVAGADGTVYRGDPLTGAFEYFTCACTGPVNALAIDRAKLYVADEFGRLLVADARTGAPQTLVQLDVGEISALASTTGGLFVGSASGLVALVDPATGERLAERTAPAGVRALASMHGNLFAATADGAIYAAPIAGGEFTYFSCFCFSNLQDLVVDGPHLVAGDGGGFVIRIDGATGELLSGQWVGPIDAMAVSGDDFLVHVGGGVIQRMQEGTNVMLDAFKSPFAPRAMLVARDAELPAAAAPKGARSGKP